jgi:hypothetical protein
VLRHYQASSPTFSWKPPGAVLADRREAHDDLGALRDRLTAPFGGVGDLVRTCCASLAAVSVVVAVISACGSAGHSATAPAAAQASAGSVTGDAASTQQLCTAISLNLSVLTKAAGSPNDPSLAESIALIRRLRDTAPAEIKDDLQVIADFDDELLATARSGGSPNGVAETPQLTQALSHEERWTAAHCPR